MEWNWKMKTYAFVLSIVFAASAATAANAANAAHHPKHHKVVATTASTTDWSGNPYMDSKPSQVAAFFRDAFNPAGIK